MYSKISDALRGNQNAAGPRVKRAIGAVVKPLKNAVKTGLTTARDSAVIGGVAGATYGKALSNNLAKSMGMAPAKNVALKTAGRYALKGVKGSLPLAALAIGAEQYLSYKESKTLKGRLATAKGKVKDKVAAIKEKVKK
jgi:hypothetical protein